MIQKIACITHDLTTTQNNFYMTHNFNQLSDEGWATYCFYFNLSNLSVLKPKFAVMNVSYIDHFNGVLISSTLESLEFILNLNNNVKKYFYVWDLEWLRGNLDYIKNVNLLRNDNVTLIARSNEHKLNIENYCNKKVDLILDNWDYNGLVKL